MLSPLVYLLMLTLLGPQIADARASCISKRLTDYFYVCQCSEIDVDSLNRVTETLDAIKILAPRAMIGLDCSNSVGTDFPDNFFDGFNIVRFKMVNCGLKELPVGLIGTFSPNLTTELDFSSNQISYIDFDGLNNLSYAGNLVSLILDQNQISELVPGSFANFSSLHNLHLENNLLQDIVDYTFEGLSNLRNLYMFKNKINHISLNAFATLENLKSLFIDLNHVEFLEEGTFSSTQQPELNAISLDGNPFYCNCSLQWLKDYLSSINYLDESAATCLYPEQAPFSQVEFC